MAGELLSPLNCYYIRHDTLFASISVADLKRWLLRINAKGLANKAKQVFQVSRAKCIFMHIIEIGIDIGNGIKIFELYKHPL